ncbi:von willebrand factor type A domain protein [Rhizoctonia solani 123E]|uniref:von willebrand factor type A domain protein n=1 Tax=Rhizoctonia solani 123E TaxID=1423351 RepID=A0A074RL63_9AGAM|nr:von willebrand factor type A domain protein [Rhizoctonia solani 123E]
MDRPTSPGANHSQTTPNALYTTASTPTSPRGREVPEVPILFMPASDQETRATFENTPALSDLPPLPDSENGSTTSLYDEDEVQKEDTNVDKEDNDLLPRISSMYRLLDLFYETGSAGQGGLVEKIIIDQKSVKLLLNTMLPESYQSISNIDFKSLDQLTIKPKGIYGDHQEIAQFLVEIGCVDDETSFLMTALHDEHDAEKAGPVLRSGLYLVLPPELKQGDEMFTAYIIYWPESTTWFDNANWSVQRNRVTFMRYLTQLSDQVVALVSTNQASVFSWDSGTRNTEMPTTQISEDDDDDSRMFTFEVAKLDEQEEDVICIPGFKVELWNLAEDKHVELIGGEAIMGVLISSKKPSTKITTHEKEEYNRFRLKTLWDRPVIMSEKISREGLRALMDNGLREKYPTLFARYESEMSEHSAKFHHDYQLSMAEIQHQLEDERPQIEKQIRNLTRARSYQFRAFTDRSRDHELADKWPPTHPISDKYPFIREMVNKWALGPPMAHIRNDRFQQLKTHISIIRYIFGLKETTEIEQRAIINRVIQEGYESLRELHDSKGTSILGKIFNGLGRLIGVKAEEWYKNHKGTSYFEQQSDFDFLSGLHALIGEYPLLFDICQQVFSVLTKYLEDRENQFVSMNLPKVIADTKQRREEQNECFLKNARKANESASWDQLWRHVYVVIQSKHGHRGMILAHLQQLCGSCWAWGNDLDPTFILRITHTSWTPKNTHYAFHPFELTQQDFQECQNDITFIPHPILQKRAQLEFDLEEARTVEFIQPMHSVCLVIVGSSQELSVFMNKNLEVGHAIRGQGHKIRFHRDNLGNKLLYAYDEITRILVLLHGGLNNPKVTWYAFDENYSSLKNGGTISLIDWYEDNAVAIRNMCFVTGKSDICLIDSSNSARVLSLDSEQFGPASLHIGAQVRNAFSAPDGSCLFVTVEDPETNKLMVRAFHWTSFGDTPGFEVANMSPESSCSITSFERRSRIHLVSLVGQRITSTSLLVKQHSAEFDFRSKESGSKSEHEHTINNCLVDCHMDVWSRFPVVPAVSRNTLSASVQQPQSITFVSSTNFSGVKEYFTKMIATFERITQKPTDGKLFAIDVGWSSEPPVITLQRSLDSKFHFGEFIVKLLCLIPIHLAVTKENCFIPLKDGVLNPAFERKLLGADVPTIINSLSVGWYESLFRSYMATKRAYLTISWPVPKGKSYCLNHFSDTSFAGSAMRTTEGVWLSCTPTDDYLLVSLDFEGVQSIERSAQEDTLLVLFNAAMSNMVLFRNNFAISRNIAGLFKSFQSSAAVLDPQSSPELFNVGTQPKQLPNQIRIFALQSDLAIIIKDVINSDAKEIVREFSQKFKSIVREEKEQNFMTRLHRGQVHIIPWPVIKSRGFYTLFHRLRNTLENQPFTHGGAGVFLFTLKTLMAKIKANDWGALDKNLAAHRAQQLTDWTSEAIGRGGIELSNGVWGPLKDIDTDQEVAYNSPISDSVFWVPNDQPDSLEANETLMENILEKLTQTYATYPGQRQALPDAAYISELQGTLNAQFDQRVEQVRDWMLTNVKRFPRENQDIRNLIATYERTVLRARAGLQLCTSKCSSCHLLCLRPNRHTTLGGHDCRTNHTCSFNCEVFDRHTSPAPCGLPSGHEGRHLCEAGKHTCGQLCTLSENTGCEKVCIKEIDHADDHICSARMHFCGKPCDLQNVIKYLSGVGRYDCPGVCQIPWDQEHARHVCSSSQSCPMECQLCPRLCCNTDHFHGLEPDETHLCGQEHTCTMLCEAPGICEIQTQPFAINEQFTGRYETFQYTRYAQEGRRLTCVVPIKPGQVYHNGPHTHSAGNTVFHYCDVQCPRCKYYCTLPLGHPQQLHETSHGSMTETQWFIDGPTASASYELQEHRYGSGDRGSTVLCSMVCSQQGRHVHVDYCRNSSGDDCRGDECQHISERVHPHPDMPKDWISHKLYWARSDPYSQAEKSEFNKCDAYCAGPEHQATENTDASPSYCKLPILHTPFPGSTPTTGYVSRDGHRFDCQNPFEGLQSYHIVFVVDSSTSMRSGDRKPLPNTPISQRLRLTCNNRYGAVLSALYGFWKERERENAPSIHAHGPAHTRSDTYTIITFNRSADVRVVNDASSTTEQLIDNLIAASPARGTNFQAAIERTQTVLETNWSTERTPVVILLSDGEGPVPDRAIRVICQMCIRLGTPLAFFTISFGTPGPSESLQRMARTAREIYATARRPGQTGSSNPCSYVNAIGSIELARTFLDISHSLQKPRAALIGSSNNRYEAITLISSGLEIFPLSACRFEDRGNV